MKMTKIEKILAVPCLSGFYFDDQKAIKSGVQLDGLTYAGRPRINGFSAVRQPGECISIILLLDNGQAAYGDCVSVQYSGMGGRDEIFLAEKYVNIIEQEVALRLRGREISKFRPLAEEFDNLKIQGKPLHTAVRYGITQAILEAVAKTKKKTMAEVIAEEYGTQLSKKPIPIFAQTGDDRYLNADKCILKRAEVLPHGLINNVETKLGRRGEILAKYLIWLKKRVKKLGDAAYNPIFHIDVYGTIGLVSNNDLEQIVSYIKGLEKICSPYKLRIEGPVDAGSKKAQIKILQELRKRLESKGSEVEIVADEWCNTLEDIKDFADAGAGHMLQIKMPDLGGINNSIEAVFYCQKKGIGAYLGGSCNETDKSARVSVHIALATQPDQILAKPCMDPDAGLMIARNEMNRTLILLKEKKVN
jgi:methylaspartate ammonia-lyase